MGIFCYAPILPLLASSKTARTENEMNHLFQAIASRVDAWRSSGYECVEYPAIIEILNFALEDGAAGQLRYLRRAQFRALETYWYLRLVLNTPRIPALYAELFPKPKDRREAMGLNASAPPMPRKASKGCL